SRSWRSGRPSTAYRSSRSPSADWPPSRPWPRSSPARRSRNRCGPMSPLARGPRLLTSSHPSTNRPPSGPKSLRPRARATSARICRPRSTKGVARAMTIDVETADTLDPPLSYPGYKSTTPRAPKLATIAAPPGEAERAGPVFGDTSVAATEADLTQQAVQAPLGERIVVSGRVLDSDSRPVRDALVEIWQANAAGRYAHQR